MILSTSEEQNYWGCTEMRLYLIRHASSMWQEGISKSKDSELSSIGKQQIGFLASHFKSLAVECKEDCMFFSSPLKRSIQTLERLVIEHEIVNELQEATFHTASKLPSISNLSLYKRCESIDNDYLEFKGHIINKLEDIIKIGHNKNIFLFTHGGVIKTILRIIHDNDGIDYIINNCSITKISWHRSRWTINYINDTSFLPHNFIT